MNKWIISKISSSKVLKCSLKIPSGDEETNEGTPKLSEVCLPIPANTSIFQKPLLKAPTGFEPIIENLACSVIDTKTLAQPTSTN